MKKRLTVPYLTRSKEDDTIDEKAIAWVSKTVPNKQTKIYHGLSPIIGGLTTCDLLLMYHVSEVMDDWSLVRNSTKFKGNFNRLMKRKKDKGFSDTAINRSFRKLTESRILIKISRKRGLYKVNPQYIFRGNEAQRKKSIISDLENSYRPLINQYRKETFDKDMALKALKKKQKDAR